MIKAILATGAEMRGSAESVCLWVCQQLSYRTEEITPIVIVLGVSPYASKEKAESHVQWAD
jgi:hypothetical protein